MSLKFKFASVIFVMILAFILALSVFTLNKSNRDMTVFNVIFALGIFVVAAVITFFFARSVVKPVTGAAKSLYDIYEGEDDLTSLITGDFKDEAETDAPGGTVTNIQSAATTLAKNTAGAQDLMESYEMGLTGLQDVMVELQEIIRSIDIVLQKCEDTDSSVKVVAEQEGTIR